MASQFVVDNQGVGMYPTLTMKVDTTANKDFSQTDLDANLTACAVSANNTVGMGTAGDKLLGFIRSFDHWVAFGLLVLIGGRMIYESFGLSEEEMLVPFLAARLS